MKMRQLVIFSGLPLQAVCSKQGILVTFSASPCIFRTVSYCLCLNLDELQVFRLLLYFNSFSVCLFFYFLPCTNFFRTNFGKRSGDSTLNLGQSDPLWAVYFHLMTLKDLWMLQKVWDRLKKLHFLMYNLLLLRELGHMISFISIKLLTAERILSFLSEFEEAQL